MVYFFLTDRPHQAKWLSRAEQSALDTALENERRITGGGLRHTALMGSLHMLTDSFVPGLYCLGCSICVTIVIVWIVATKCRR